MKLYLTSKSFLKCSIVNQILKDLKLYNLFELNPYTTYGTPEQPIDTTLVCCNKRIEFIELNLNSKEESYFLSIENGLEKGMNDQYVDICYVVLKTKEKEYINKSQSVFVKSTWLDQAKAETPFNYEHIDLGLSTTIGEIINRENSNIPKDDWMSFYGLKRIDQIMPPLRKCFIDWQKDQLQKNITFYENFPKPGVIYQDMSYILNNKIQLRFLINCMADLVLNKFGKIDQIAGLDSRGFIYGSLLASEIGSGFVMIRKKGKLPGETVTTGYETEYSSDNFEMLKNVIKKNERVLVIDDLVATGGSLLAATKLINEVEGDVIGSFTILKVDPLFEIASNKIKNLITLF